MKCPYLHIKCPNRETPGELKDNCLLKEPWACPHQDKQDELLLTELKEIVLEIRQYLCNTEFAPEPFKEPIDPNKLTVEFPNQILAKVKQHYQQKKICKLGRSPMGKPSGCVEFGFCENCEHQQKMLDRPDREKILEIINPMKWMNLRKGEEWQDDGVDQILALIPDMGEIESRIETVTTQLKTVNKKLDDREKDLIEAKREERERIFAEGEQFFHPDPSYTDIQGFLKWWQTLKEEK